MAVCSGTGIVKEGHHSWKRKRALHPQINRMRKHTDTHIHFHLNEKKMSVGYFNLTPRQVKKNKSLPAPVKFTN